MFFYFYLRQKYNSGWGRVVDVDQESDKLQGTRDKGQMTNDKGQGTRDKYK
jgi:hypothetical protein